jgi:FKBP-type peptidyl-prolyl cis-trans isomerase SlyD
VWHTACAVNTAATTIGPDSFVTISYRIFEDGKTEPVDVGVPEGQEETTDEDRFVTRLSYVHGYGLMVPALEKGLAGSTSGAKVVVHADPVDAFGMYEQDGVLEIEKEGLEGSDELAEGDEVLAVGPDGEMIMRVLEVRAETIVVDTNHPLAGKKLRFEVEVEEVRAATDEEIEEAQEELEDLADGCGCGEDHDHSASAHSAHEPEVVQASDLVQLGLGKTKPGKDEPGRA